MHKIKAGYSTYIFGNNAMVPPIKVPKDWTKEMAKLTVKEQIKLLTKQRDEATLDYCKAKAQLSEQNTLLERARHEGNQLIEKYNKIAGGFNSIRTLVTTND